MPMDSKENRKKYRQDSWKNKRFFDSAKHAWEGVTTIWREERNLRNHFGLGIFPILAGLLLGISKVEWMIIVLCIFLVVIMEFLNTIIETVVDMVTDYDYHPLAKKAKDIAAGAVLVTAVFTIVIASIIFIPRIVEILY